MSLLSIRPIRLFPRTLPVQRRLGPEEVAALVAAYRQGVPVEELATSFRVNRTTVLWHARRHGIAKRDRRALRLDDVERAAKLYAEGQSAEWVARELQVAASTVRRALKDAGVTVRPKGRQRRGDR
ncbi:MAG: helix-turn-helix domain-containing protein [Mycobacteriales bacterium]